MSEQQLELPLAPVVAPPRNDLHMAVDVSTLSDSPSAVVASVAYVVFDPKDTGGANDTYFKTVDWDQRERGYNWPKVQEWMTKSGLARRAIVNLTPPVPLVTAMTAINEAYTKHRCTAIWGTRRVLNTVENAMSYCKKEPAWSAGQARDLASCWGTGLEQGQVVDIERHETEPEDVPLGNAAFVARAVRHLYGTYHKATPPDTAMK